MTGVYYNYKQSRETSNDKENEFMTKTILTYFHTQALIGHLALPLNSSCNFFMLIKCNSFSEFCSFTNVGKNLYNLGF